MKMNMQYFGNDTDRGRPNYSETNLSNTISHELTWDRTLGPAIRGWQLTAKEMARPSNRDFI